MPPTDHASCRKMVRTGSTDQGGPWAAAVPDAEARMATGTTVPQGGDEQRLAELGDVQDPRRRMAGGQQLRRVRVQPRQRAARLAVPEARQRSDPHADELDPALRHLLAGPGDPGDPEPG